MSECIENEMVFECLIIKLFVVLAMLGDMWAS